MNLVIPIYLGFDAPSPDFSNTRRFPDPRIRLLTNLKTIFADVPRRLDGTFTLKA